MRPHLQQIVITLIEPEPQSKLECLFTKDGRFTSIELAGYEAGRCIYVGRQTDGTDRPWGGFIRFDTPQLAAGSLIKVF